MEKPGWVSQFESWLSIDALSIQGSVGLVWGEIPIRQSHQGLTQGQPMKSYGLRSGPASVRLVQ